MEKEIIDFRPFAQKILDRMETIAEKLRKEGKLPEQDEENIEDNELQKIMDAYAEEKSKKIIQDSKIERL